MCALLDTAPRTRRTRFFWLHTGGGCYRFKRKFLEKNTVLQSRHRMRERDAKIITPRGRGAAFVSIRTSIYICTVSRQSRHLDTAYITHHSGVHLVGLCSSYILTRGDSYMVPRRRSRDHEKASPNLYHSTNKIHTPYE